MTYTEFTYDLVAEESEEFDSEAIECVAFDAEQNKMFVEFKAGGEYVYSDIPESLYNLFVEADSLGKFYRDHISGKYTSEKDSFFLREREAPLATVTAIRPEVEDVSDVFTDLAKDFEEAGLTSTFGVKWQMGEIIAEPTFSAVSEEDALRQFNDQVNRAFGSLDIRDSIKVLAVTHYFN